jgi:hypothetical protein
MAMRRRVMPLRARETLIIPITHVSWGTIGAWEALLDSEARWLPLGTRQVRTAESSSDPSSGLTRRTASIDA